MVKLNQLTPAEEAVIIHKATERPFSGRFEDHFETGVYVCRQCNAPLFRSEDKFNAFCGWPSFDKEIPGSVKKTYEPDTDRYEISCNRCGGHLGHVFFGEHFTLTETRHCVNSTSLAFIPGDTKQKG